MQHCGDATGRPKVLPVVRKLQQRSTRRFKQQVIHGLAVAHCQRIELMRHREHHMVVCSRKKLCRKILHPLFFLQAAAIRAVAVAATMILMVQVLAIRVVAPVSVQPQTGRVAVVQLVENAQAHRVGAVAGSLGKCGLQLMANGRMLPLVLLPLSCLSAVRRRDSLSQFFIRRLGRGLYAAHTWPFCMASKGETMVDRLACCRCRYTIVVLMLLCPSSSLIV